MKLSHTAPTALRFQPPAPASQTSQVEQLNKQIERLQKQAQKLKENRTGNEAEKERIKQIEEEILRLQGQVADALIQDKQRELEKVGVAAAEKVEEEAQERIRNEDGDELILSGMSPVLIGASRQYGNLEVLRKVQLDKLAQKDILGAERIAGQILSRGMDIQNQLTASATRDRDTEPATTGAADDAEGADFEQAGSEETEATIASEAQQQMQGDSGKSISTE
ncbi:hypothetical protein PA598K_07215 [Paenibacillus sp. 598K]|uniref:FlxA-like family protein n=1 Tax=Paenibacillus sp. 598K TaxID=1117987 RepID=UPI000FFA903F|nr:FlxA-like family protein [Paenibacillus sp. 598K]GBF78544.1 hypothetical protein PA598K_07215 [Paenibacillus sp. 598K]